ncbi:MAG TPA: DUF721 domain-containing protein [Deinococcales bacterium]|nr:DUF721 domain-containing protein [Deinococcales bacterium]
MSDRPRPPRKGGQVRVSSIIGRILARPGLSNGVREARVRLAWKKVAGPGLARATRAVLFRDGVLVVETQDTVAAHMLSHQRSTYLKDLKRLLGRDAPRDLHFQMGSFEEEPEAEAPAATTVQVDESAVTTLALGASDDLRDSVARAARALLAAQAQRSQAGFACPVCGTATLDPGPCLPCQWRLETRPVALAAQRLLLDPDGEAMGVNDPREWLDDEGLRCARYEAATMLEEHLNELLEPLTTEAASGLGDLRAAEARRELQEAARRYLAVKLDRRLAAVSRADAQALPERVANLLNALGGWV